MTDVINFSAKKSYKNNAKSYKNNVKIKAHIRQVVKKKTLSTTSTRLLSITTQSAKYDVQYVLKAFVTAFTMPKDALEALK